MKATWTGLVAVLSLALAGCMGGNSTTGGTKEPQKGQLAVSPSSAMLRGGDTQTFSAAEGGAAVAPAVAWSVNGVAGGSATIGTISVAGVYVAPEFPPNGGAVTITAVETADATKTAGSAVTVDNPIPQVSTVAPTSIPVGTFTLTVNGAHFATGTAVQFGSTTLTTTRVSSTKLTATGTATSAEVGNISVMVKNPDPGSVASATVTAKVVNSGPITVAISPTTVTLRPGNNQGFTATVTGSSNTAVTWTVNNSGLGSATAGYVNPFPTFGTYSPPGIVPTPNTVTVTAISAADPTKKASATVTLVNPAPVLTAVNPGSIGVGPFLLTVTGSRFVNGAKVNFGGQALTTMFVSATELTATGTATASQAGNVAVTVTNPNPGSTTSGALSANVVNGGQVISAAAAVRFLEQSTFGPTPALTNQLQQTGFDTFLQGQFSASTSIYPIPAAADSDLSKVQTAFFKNAVNDGDQLRQRAAFALNELWVVGANKVSDPVGYSNYMASLTKDGLGNYYNVMKDVTLTPAMGHWLDMVNNDKPGNGQHANENYARELMQLFTLGLSQLNPDGTPKLDGSGVPIPTYTQDDVMALGRSFTGWTYPTEPGQSLMKHNPEFYGGPMVPFESNHDTGAKTFLGQSVAAGQSAGQELDSVLTIIFNHPNLPPFVATQLIEKLVTSNPSPAYVQRVAQAFISGKFNTYGTGQRGDMQAVAAAILLDPEARRGDNSITAVTTDGKLREPVVMEVAVARAFGATTDGSGFSGQGATMSQNLFNSGSVFNFFPPTNLIPQTPLNGPEFAIFNTNTSLARVNFINSIVYGQISGTTALDFSPVVNAGTPDQMVAWLDTNLLHGTISDSMKQSILTAVNASSTTDTSKQAKTAIYLVLSSSQYQVQR